MRRLHCILFVHCARRRLHRPWPARFQGKTLNAPISHEKLSLLCIHYQVTKECYYYRFLLLLCCKTLSGCTYSQIGVYFSFTNSRFSLLATNGSNASGRNTLAHDYYNTMFSSYYVTKRGLIKFWNALLYVEIGGESGVCVSFSFKNQQQTVLCHTHPLHFVRRLSRRSTRISD